MLYRQPQERNGEIIPTEKMIKEGRERASRAGIFNHLCRRVQDELVVLFSLISIVMMERTTQANGGYAIMAGLMLVCAVYLLFTPHTSGVVKLLLSLEHGEAE